MRWQATLAPELKRAHTGKENPEMKEMPEPWFGIDHGKQWPLWVGALLANPTSASGILRGHWPRLQKNRELR